AEGEKFMAASPSSEHFDLVRGRVDQAIEHKREQENGARALVEMIKREYSDRDRANPCRMAIMYNHYSQWKEARGYYEACLTSGKDELSPGLVMHDLAWVTY